MTATHTGPAPGFWEQWIANTLQQADPRVAQVSVTWGQDGMPGFAALDGQGQPVGLAGRIELVFHRAVPRVTGFRPPRGS